MLPFFVVDALHRAFCDAGFGLDRAFEAFSNFVAATAVSALWQGIALGAGMALALRVTPRISAAHRFVLWSTAFGALLVLPFVPVIGHQFRSAGAATAAAVRSSAAHPWLALDARWSLVIAGLWLLFSILRTTDLVAHSIRLGKLWRAAKPIDPGVIPAAMRRNCRICTTADLDRPSVIGFLRPRILIPYWLLPRLSAGELEQIVLHECEHLRRRDDWTNLVQKLCLALFPLNPGLWYIERQLAKEREMACDESVVRITGAPRAYAACLASLAERGLERGAESLSLGAWQRRPELVDRVHRILSRRQLLQPATSRVLVGGFACALLVAAVELNRCPQLIAFVNEPTPQTFAAASQLGDAVYPAVPARHDARSSFYALPAKALVPASQLSETGAYRARAVDAHQNTAAVGELRAASAEPGHTPPAKATHSFRPGAQSDGKVPEQLIVFTAWEQVYIPEPSSQTIADYDTSVSASEPASKPAPSDIDPNSSTTSRITITRLVFKVVPQGTVSNPRAGSGVNNLPAQPAAIPFGDGWLVIQL
jgi:beta-lactamase regulating signal transducer with metallopeptidase domain